MIEINNQEELKKYYDEKTNTYIFEDDVRFNYDIVTPCNINARNIYSDNIIAAPNINADDIVSRCIEVTDIIAKNIYSLYIYANNINVHNIVADDIFADDISYYEYCIAFGRLKGKTCKK